MWHEIWHEIGLIKLFKFAFAKDPLLNKQVSNKLECMPDMFLPDMPERPKCRRCNGPLDLCPEEDGHYNWGCNNLQGQSTPIMTDEELKERWKDLPGDEVVRLLKYTYKEN